MKRILLLVLFGFALSTAYSQNTTRYTASGGILGAVNFTKFAVSDDNPEVDYESKAGFSLGGWLNLPLSSSFSIEPQLTYSSYRYLTDNTTTLLLNDGKISYISLPVALKFHVGENIAIIAGPQLDFLSSVKDNRNVATEEGFNKTSFSIFGGLEAFPHKRVSLFARYVHGLSDMNDGATHTTSPYVYKNQNIQLGLKLRLFGGKKVETEVLQATSTPVPLDTDGDGITDDVDKCPTVAGLAKYNGCPIPDTDGDGINDELDKCPNQAGTAKYDGCPVPDKDGDGINDEMDKCPDIAGIAANNGCPEVPANVTKSLQLASQNVAFGTGANNVVLTTRSNASLDKIVTIMNENPGLHIRVEAHTDNTGDDAANMQLTSDRAAAVKAYLVSKGISEDRITTEGFGETMPIADNGTSSGRVKNRRVEIKMAF